MFPLPALDWSMAALYWGLVAIGVLSLLRAAVHARGAWRAEGYAQVLRGAHGLRALLVGAALIGVGAGLLIESRALFIVALAIGLEELYETTMAIGVLRHIAREGEVTATARG